MNIRIITATICTTLLTACPIIDEKKNPPPNPSPDDKPSSPVTARFAVISDPHLYDAATLGKPTQEELDKHLEMVTESVEILDAALADLKTQKLDFVLIPGDLTLEGEKASHDLMALKLADLKAAGTQVLVIPGNHDLNNPNAKRFPDSTPTQADSVTPEEFKTIYAEFGFSGAVAVDPNSLSYVAEPVTGLWILAIDSCKYRDNQTGPDAKGELSPATQEWIVSQLKAAKEQKKEVLAMMHHGIVEHFTGQAENFPDSVIKDSAAIDQKLADNDLSLIFTGHFHASDVILKDFGSSKLYDCETGTLVNAPNGYRLVEYAQQSRSYRIDTQYVTSIPSHPTDFVAFSVKYLGAGLIRQVNSELAQYNFPEAIKQEVSSLIVDAGIVHCKGDEPIDEDTRTKINVLTSLGEQATRLHDDLLNLWNDPKPVDNQLTIELGAP